MSAFYSFLYPDCVKILTDGAHFDRDGVIVHLGRKIFTSPRLPLAITARGTAAEYYAVLLEVEHQVEKATTVDEVLKNFSRHLWNLGARKSPIDAEFLIAGFSETQGPVHFYAQCHLRNEHPSFEILNLGDQICGTGGASISLSDFDEPVRPEDVSLPDFPERYAIEIMDILRRTPSKPSGAASEYYTIGGQCDLTTIDKRRASTRTLHYWPDAVGSKIEPRMVV